MISQVSQPRLKGFRFPRSVISYAVWAYHRFALSLRDVEDLLAERGVIVSYESVRVWCQRFGTQVASSIRRDRPARPTNGTSTRVKAAPKTRQWRVLTLNGRSPRRDLDPTPEALALAGGRRERPLSCM
jgi:putative transposase